MAKLEDVIVRRFGDNSWLNRRQNVDEIIEFITKQSTQFPQNEIDKYTNAFKFLSKHCSGQNFKNDKQWSELMNEMKISKLLNHKSVKVKDLIKNLNLILANKATIERLNESANQLDYIDTCFGEFDSLIDGLGLNLTSDDAIGSSSQNLATNIIKLTEKENLSWQLMRVKNAESVRDTLEYHGKPILESIDLCMQDYSNIIPLNNSNSIVVSDLNSKLASCERKIQAILSLVEKIVMIQEILIDLMPTFATKNLENVSLNTQIAQSLLSFKKHQDLVMQSLVKVSSSNSSIKPVGQYISIVRLLNAGSISITTKASKQSLLNSTIILLDKTYETLIECKLKLNLIVAKARQEFTRLYFANEQELIRIVSLDKELLCRKNIDEFKDSLQKIFTNSFNRIIVSEYDDERKQIVGVMSQFGETIHLTDKNIITYHDKDDKSIAYILNQLVASLKLSLEESLIEFMNEKINNKQNENLLMSSRDEMKTRLKPKDFLTLPLQLMTLVEQLEFTRRTELALISSKDAKVYLTDLIQRYENRLSLISQLENHGKWDEDEKLTNIEIKVFLAKLSNIKWLSIHFISIINSLISSKVETKEDWNWQKQVRYYLLEQRKLVVYIANSCFDYKFELLPIVCHHQQTATTTDTNQIPRSHASIKPMLTQTTLTDRCFLISSQAIGNLKLGINLFGPAGSGKTESVKAFGSAIGNIVIVHNCDGSNEPKALLDLTLGLAKSGLWACLDEFNRLSENTLSLIGALLEKIQTSVRENKGYITLASENNSEQVHVSIDKSAAFFVTLNPSNTKYAARSLLPSNLRSLLLPVAMFRVEFATIAAEHLLASLSSLLSDNIKDNGQATSLVTRKLASQLAVWLQKCGDTKALSSSPIQWDLRLLVAIFRRMTSSLNSIQKEENPMTELYSLLTTILTQAIKCEVRSRLNDDESLEIFYDIVKNVFEVESKQTAGENNTKRGHLINQLEYRSGVMLIGNNKCGKTQTWLEFKQLKDQESSISKSNFIIINPNSLSKSLMFGHLVDERNIDDLKQHSTIEQKSTGKNQWSDGLFSCKVREAISDLEVGRYDQVYIILDGEIDSSWVELLNSVLDESRVLTLGSGERLSFVCNTNKGFTGEIKLIFESSSLEFSSPATISRLGCVVFDGNHEYQSQNGRLKSAENSYENIVKMIQGNEETAALLVIGKLGSYTKTKLIEEVSNSRISHIFEFHCSKISTSIDFIGFLKFMTNEHKLASKESDVRYTIEYIVVIHNFEQIIKNQSLKNNKELVALLRFVLEHKVYYNINIDGKKRSNKYDLKKLNFPIKFYLLADINSDEFEELKTTQNKETERLLKSLRQVEFDVSICKQILNENIVSVHRQEILKEIEIAKNEYEIDTCYRLLESWSDVQSLDASGKTSLYPKFKFDDNSTPTWEPTISKQDDDLGNHGISETILSAIAEYQKTTNYAESISEYMTSGSSNLINIAYLAEWFLENSKISSSVYNILFVYTSEHSDNDLRTIFEAIAIGKLNYTQVYEWNFDRNYASPETNSGKNSNNLQIINITVENCRKLESFFGKILRYASKLRAKSIVMASCNQDKNVGKLVKQQHKIKLKRQTRRQNGKILLIILDDMEFESFSSEIKCSILRLMSLISKLNSNYHQFNTSSCLLKIIWLSQIERQKSFSSSYGLIVEFCPKPSDKFGSDLRKILSSTTTASHLPKTDANDKNQADVSFQISEQFENELITFISANRELRYNEQRARNLTRSLGTAYKYLISRLNDELGLIETALSVLNRLKLNIENSQAACEKANVELANKSNEINELTIVSTESANNAEIQRKEALEKQGMRSNLALECQKKAEQLMIELESNEKRLGQSKTSIVTKLKPEALDELRKLRAPPTTVRDILELILRILGYADSGSWATMRSFLAKPSLRDELIKFSLPPELSLKSRWLTNIESLLVERSTSYTIQAAARASQAALPMLEWALATIELARATAKSEPSRKELSSLQKQLDELAAESLILDTKAKLASNQLDEHKKKLKSLEFQRQILSNELKDNKKKLEDNLELDRKLSVQKLSWQERHIKLNKILKSRNDICSNLLTLITGGNTWMQETSYVQKLESIANTCFAQKSAKLLENLHCNDETIANDKLNELHLFTLIELSSVETVFYLSDDNDSSFNEVNKNLNSSRISRKLRETSKLSSYIWPQARNSSRDFIEISLASISLTQFRRTVESCAQLGKILLISCDENYQSELFMMLMRFIFCLTTNKLKFSGSSTSSTTYLEIDSRKLSVNLNFRLILTDISFTKKEENNLLYVLQTRLTPLKLKDKVGDSHERLIESQILDYYVKEIYKDNNKALNKQVEDNNNGIDESRANEFEMKLLRKLLEFEKTDSSNSNDEILSKMLSSVQEANDEFKHQLEANKINFVEYQKSCEKVKDFATKATQFIVEVVFPLRQVNRFYTFDSVKIANLLMSTADIKFKKLNLNHAYKYIQMAMKANDRHLLFENKFNIKSSKIEEKKANLQQVIEDFFSPQNVNTTCYFNLLIVCQGQGMGVPQFEAIIAACSKITVKFNKFYAGDSLPELLEEEGRGKKDESNDDCEKNRLVCVLNAHLAARNWLASLLELQKLMEKQANFNDTNNNRRNHVSEKLLVVLSCESCELFSDELLASATKVWYDELSDSLASRFNSLLTTATTDALTTQLNNANNHTKWLHERLVFFHVLCQELVKLKRWPGGKAYAFDAQQLQVARQVLASCIASCDSSSSNNNKTGNADNKYREHNTIDNNNAYDDNIREERVAKLFVNLLEFGVYGARLENELDERQIGKLIARLFGNSGGDEDEIVAKLIESFHASSEYQLADSNALLNQLLA